MKRREKRRKKEEQKAKRVSSDASSGDTVNLEPRNIKFVSVFGTESFVMSDDSDSIYDDQRTTDNRHNTRTGKFNRLLERDEVLPAEHRVNPLPVLPGRPFERGSGTLLFSLPLQCRSAVCTVIIKSVFEVWQPEGGLAWHNATETQPPRSPAGPAHSCRLYAMSPGKKKEKSGMKGKEKNNGKGAC